MYKPDLIAVCESWLHEGIPIGNYSLEGYRCYIKNRFQRRGGGVMLYVAEKLESYSCDFLNNVEVEDSCWCIIKTKSDNILVGVTYRSPSSSHDNNAKIVECIDKLRRVERLSSILLMGDFNYPEIDWEAGIVRTGNADAARFYEAVQGQYLFQCVDSPTRVVMGERPSILDLVFTNEVNMVHDLEIVAPLGKSDHSGLLFEFVLPDEVHKFEKTTDRKRNYFKGDFSAMRERLQEIDWSQLDESLDVESMYNSIKTIVCDLVNEFVPYNKPKKTIKTVPKSVKKAAKKKRMLHKRYSITHSREDWEAYRVQRNITTGLIDKYEMEEELRLARNFKENPKLLHKYIRNRTKVKDKVEALKNVNGDLCYKNKEKADILGKQFHSVFVKENLENIPSVTMSRSRISDLIIDEEEVRNRLGKLKDSKAIGPDEIHPKVLKECAGELSVPVAKLFRLSLSRAEVPLDWKKAHVCPIFKKGSVKLAENYRPVSLTSQLCKVMESIIRDHIVSFLENEQIIDMNQHGFRVGRSCKTNLLETLEDWTKEVNENRRVDCVYLDYQKAFDTVPHKRLLLKLEAIGVRGVLVKWIEAFLVDRIQRVIVEGELSDWTNVLSGVPQGSVLGPTLFLIYINDLSDAIKSTVKLFADDTKVYRTIKASEDIQVLQDDLCKMCKWAEVWQMQFNIEKCKTMHINGNEEHANYYMVTSDNTRVNLQVVNEEKDLGIKISNDLKSSRQCSSVIGSATGSMRKLHNTFKHMNTEIFKKVYPSYVRSHLETSVQVWSPHLLGEIDRIEKVQRRATKSVRELRRFPYEERLKKLKLYTLSKRRLRGDLIEVFRIVKGFSALKVEDFFQFARVRDTRGHRFKLYKKGPNCTVRQAFFSQRIVNEWNNLPECVVNADSVNMFKNKLDKEWNRTGYGYLSR